MSDTFNFFAVQSGNLGDTSALLPVLSGLYKTYNKKINLVVRDKCKNFKGFKELYQFQPCINKVKFESDKLLNLKNYTPIYLANEYETSILRPYEVSRYEYWLKKNLKLDFKVDDEFVLLIPEGGKVINDKYIIGDRIYTKNADTRRLFNILKDSGKFPEDKCYFLDVNNSLIHNLQIIRNSNKPFLTTFTGISVLTNLANIDTLVFYDDNIAKWDGKTIDYSFRKHFYFGRGTELAHIDEF